MDLMHWIVFAVFGFGALAAVLWALDWAMGGWRA